MTPVTHLGKYDILAELGRGGYAVTYRAHDRDLDRDVALKILKPAWLDDAVAVERFTREARSAAKLHHPHIAAIYDVGQVDGRLYIAMHLVEGRSLDRVLREDGPLPWDKALAILGDVASALDYAHAHDLIHRDVKPANIIISAEEGAVLTDFGLVKAAQSASMSSGNLTGVNTPGTSAYMAPEIWLGQPATSASDLYALAAIAGEIISGKSLFLADTLEAVIARHLTLGPAWPEKWPAEVPDQSQTVIAQALQREPHLRYQTAVGFARALELTSQPAMTELPISTPLPATPRGEGLQQPARPGTLWPIMVVIVGILVVVLLLANQGPTQTQIEPTNRPTNTLVPTSWDTETPSATVTPVSPTTSPTFVPGEVLYRVKEGDSVASIAAMFGVQPDDLWAENNLPNNATLSVGQQLIIPFDTVTATLTSTPTLTPSRIPTKRPLPTSTSTPLACTNGRAFNTTTGNCECPPGTIWSDRGQWCASIEKNPNSPIATPQH